jgi:hypothetical protein
MPEPDSSPTTQSEAEVGEAASETQRSLSVQRQEAWEAFDEGAPCAIGIAAGQPSGMDDKTDDILTDRQITR